MNYAILPACNVPGYVLVSTGDGQGGCLWAPGTQGTRRLMMGWGWSGPTILPAGTSGQIPEQTFALGNNQLVTVLGVRYYSRTAGGVFEIFYNGSALGAPATWTTATSWTTDTTSSVWPITVADGDRFQPVFTTIGGSDTWGIQLIYSTT